jgi:hypothetical protein
MATPVRQRHTLPGAPDDLLVDTLGSSDRAPRPAVVILREFSALEERLARAGFTAVSIKDGSEARRPGPADVESVIAALDRGGLGVPRPTSIGIVAHRGAEAAAVLTAAGTPRISALVTSSAIPPGDAAAAAQRVMIPWLLLQEAGPADLERVLDETTGWLSRHLP